MRGPKLYNIALTSKELNIVRNALGEYESSCRGGRKQTTKESREVEHVSALIFSQELKQVDSTGKVSFKVDSALDSVESILLWYISTKGPHCLNVIKECAKLRKSLISLHFSFLELQRKSTSQP